MRGDKWQIILIISGILVAALLGIFLLREIYPEYRIYQNDYIALEKFRASYTHQPIPPFKEGVKQIVMEKEDKGPAIVDRCTSCHVALQIPYFSPTKLAHDSNGNIIHDAGGKPVQIPNDEYIWLKLDEKIAELKDPHLNAKLKQEGKKKLLRERLNQASYYESLKTAQVGNQTYDVTKALSMHPLMGHETRPFEYHPIEDYGCTSCHNGNGRGLTTDKAHGPVFDEQYEKEDRGFVPQFTEPDPANDPLFSREFNAKPGHELLFQTTPIFVGALIQAKCVQCHKPSGLKTDRNAEQLNYNQDLLLHTELSEKSFGESVANPQVTSALTSDVDLLTHNYQRGRELYLSQACYACHRIAGFARGGVGPELTKIGENYPWYIKESVVWPQADLATSTMPNMRLDHQELENIMTFLLAQKGGNRSMAATEYQASIQSWEAGSKLPWEKPIPPTQMYDLRYAMTVFATQGCASCHRLEGFDSNVTFKQDSSESKKLHEDETWFKKLFPEVIHISNYDEVLPGSMIVEAIENNAAEIDERIVSNRNKNGLLEEIDRNYPEVIEAMYSNFRYASRAKNTLFHNENEKLDAWKERVHRVLMMYIQVYGFGRLIGPHLNWSGIYRSDEWLMEHFRNPTSHVPRSIMPAMPFDDTKFYALTNMLDRLGIVNRDAVRRVWDTDGFDPEEAYSIHCAQCHGISLQGNGVIAEWIYPIPKNLKNPDFLRNLSKEQAIRSITHGVKGTPMPPWGEVSSDKSDALVKETVASPVLNANEIKILVDWLFYSLPGGGVSEENKFIPKWHYTPEDVLKELYKEGGKLKKKSAFNLKGHLDAEILSLFPNGNGLYASLEPNLLALNTGSPHTMSVNDVFDIVPDTKFGGKNLYYIKKEYYTPENIEAGKDFFLLNCAVCHGSEADGSGIRGQAMHDAKPRMLTNLDWIDSKDDLRLLRSIKYGVQGTSMVPWGDFTSSLQRMQLVMFIRTLSQEQNERHELNSAIYQTYDTAQLIVDRGRIDNTKKMEEIRKAIENNEIALEKLEKEIANGNQEAAAAFKLYQETLSNKQLLQKYTQDDHLLTEILNLLKQEKTLYQNLGYAFIMKRMGDSILENYNKLILLNQNRYEIKEGRLIFSQSDTSKAMRELRNTIEKEFQLQIDQLAAERESIEARLNSSSRTQALEDNEANSASLKQLESKLITDTEKAWELAVKQKETLQYFTHLSQEKQ